MKIFLTGASGYVGAKVYLALKSNHSVFGLYNSNRLFPELVKLDLTDREETIIALNNYSPDLIIHIAADSHSKECEKDPEHAIRLNVDATSTLVDYAKTNNIPVIYISTFACFNPGTVLGKTKKKAEELIENLNSYLIIRASLVIGMSPNNSNDNFFNQLVSDICDKRIIEADTSWKFEFTYLNDIVELIKQFLQAKLPNLNIPLITDGVYSKYDIARIIAKPFGLKVIPVDLQKNIPVEKINKDNYAILTFKRKTALECLKEMHADITEFVKKCKS